MDPEGELGGLLDIDVDEFGGGFSSANGNGTPLTRNSHLLQQPVPQHHQQLHPQHPQQQQQAQLLHASPFLFNSPFPSQSSQGTFAAALQEHTQASQFPDHAALLSQQQQMQMDHSADLESPLLMQHGAAPQWATQQQQQNHRSGTSMLYSNSIEGQSQMQQMQQQQYANGRMATPFSPVSPFGNGVNEHPNAAYLRAQQSQMLQQQIQQLSQMQGSNGNDQLQPFAFGQNRMQPQQQRPPQQQSPFLPTDPQALSRFIANQQQQQQQQQQSIQLLQQLQHQQQQQQSHRHESEMRLPMAPPISAGTLPTKYSHLRAASIVDFDAPQFKSEASDGFSNVSHSDSPPRWSIQVLLRAGDKSWAPREVLTTMQVSFSQLLHQTTNIHSYVSVTVGKHPAQGAECADKLLADHPTLQHAMSRILEEHVAADTEVPRILPLGTTLTFDLGPNVKSCTRLGCPRLLLKKASRRACDHCQTHGFDLTVRQIRTLHLQEPVLSAAGKAHIQAQVEATQAQGGILDPTLAAQLTAQLIRSTNMSSSLGTLLEKAVQRVEHWKFEGADANSIFLAFASEEAASQVQTTFERLVRQQLHGVPKRGRRLTKPGFSRVTSPLSNESVPSVGPAQMDSDSEAPPRHRTRSAGRHERARNGTAPTPVPTTASAATTASAPSSRSNHSGQEHSKSHSSPSRSSSRSAIDMHGLDTDDGMGLLGLGDCPDPLGMMLPLSTSSPVPSTDHSTPTAEVTSPAPIQLLLTQHMTSGSAAAAYTVRMKSHFWKLEVRGQDPISGKVSIALYKKIGKPNQKRGHGPDQPISAANRILGLGRSARRRASKAEMDDDGDDGDYAGEDVEERTMVKTEPVSPVAPAVGSKRRHAQALPSPTPSVAGSSVARQSPQPVVHSTLFASHSSAPANGSPLKPNLQKVITNGHSASAVDSSWTESSALASSQVLVSGDDFARMKHHAVSATMQVSSRAGHSSMTTTFSSTTHSTPVLLIYRDRKQLHRDMAHGYLGDAPSSDDDGAGPGAGQNGGDGSRRFGGGPPDQARREQDPDNEDEGDDNHKRRKVDTHGMSRQLAGSLSPSGKGLHLSVPISNSALSRNPPGGVGPLNEEKSMDERGAVFDHHVRLSSSDEKDTCEGSVSSSHSADSGVIARNPGWRGPAAVTSRFTEHDDNALSLRLDSQDEDDSNGKGLKRSRLINEEDDYQGVGKKSMSLNLKAPEWLRAEVFGTPVWRVFYGYGPLIAVTIMLLMGLVGLVFLGANIANGGGLDSNATPSPLTLFSRHPNPGVEAAMRDQTSVMVKTFSGKMRATSSVFRLWALQAEQPIEVVDANSPISPGGGQSGPGSQQGPSQGKRVDDQPEEQFGGAGQFDLKQADGPAGPPYQVIRHRGQSKNSIMRSLATHPSISNETVIRNISGSPPSFQLTDVTQLTSRCQESVQASRVLSFWLMYTSELGPKFIAEKPFDGDTTSTTADSYGGYPTNPTDLCHSLDTAVGRLFLYRTFCTSMGSVAKVRPYCNNVDGFAGQDCPGIMSFIYSNNYTASAFMWPSVDRSSSSAQLASESAVTAVSRTYWNQADLLNVQCGYFDQVVQLQTTQGSLLARSEALRLDGGVLAVLLFGTVGMVLFCMLAVMIGVWSVRRLVNGKPQQSVSEAPVVAPPRAVKRSGTPPQGGRTTGGTFAPMYARGEHGYSSSSSQIIEMA